MDDNPKYADLVVSGAVAKNSDKHRKTKIALQRAIDSGGDTITIMLPGEKANNLIYMIETQSIKNLLDMELREDEVKDDKRITERNIGSPIICPGCGDHRYWKYDVSIGKYVCKCGRPLEYEEIESELNKGYEDYIREKEQKGCDSNG